jgi:hypothetical protein
MLWQAGHRTCNNGVPQALQNLAVAELAWPHWRQVRELKECVLGRLSGPRADAIIRV